MNDSVFLKFTLLNIFLLFFGIAITKAQKVIFPRDFSPAEGLVTPQEKPYRDEVCLNGYWELQSVPVPSSWEGGTGVAPELPVPQEVNGKW